jgi:transcriptional regulator with XRE-family HTH domain
MKKRAGAPPKTGVRGDRVRALRKAKKFSQLRLVETMAEFGATVDQTYISMIENGNLSLNPDALVTMAKALDTNPGYLIGATDDPRPHEELEKEIAVSVEDERERQELERLFRALRTLPPETRKTYYTTLRLMYESLIRQAEEAGRSAMTT